MTKQQLIDTIAEETSHAKNDVEKILDSFITTIGKTLEAGEKVDLRGFGNFSVKDKKPRTGRNPRTGETIQIPAKREAAFKPGKELTDRLASTMATVGDVSVS
jgi:integration host factor subunit beta